MLEYDFAEITSIWEVVLEGQLRTEGNVPAEVYPSADAKGDRILESLDMKKVLGF